MGRSCHNCCYSKQNSLFRFINLTVDGGFTLPSGVEETLFKDVPANLVYCIFGNLKDWLDLSTGIFNVRETGLYAISILPTFEVSPNDGDRLVRVKRIYGSPRCNGTSFEEISFLGQTQSIGTTSLENDIMTFSAVQPLASGDKLEFLAFQSNSETADATLFYELNITKISSAVKSLFDPKQTLPPN